MYLFIFIHFTIQLLSLFLKAFAEVLCYSSDYKFCGLEKILHIVSNTKVMKEHSRIQITQTNTISLQHLSAKIAPVFLWSPLGVYQGCPILSATGWCGCRCKFQLSRSPTYSDSLSQTTDHVLHALMKRKHAATTPFYRENQTLLV